MVLHPITGKSIPIIVDAELVDAEFGTGVVKVTPAHDVNDLQCAGRHADIFGNAHPQGFDQKGFIISNLPKYSV
jgi:valyl-tRNA synthetase